MSDGLDELDWLLGAWHGDQNGMPGTGTGERQYRRIVAGRFIEIRHTSTYEPQDGNPDGEIHEEFGVFSADEAAGTISLREFHSEGYVISYGLVEHIGDEMVFASTQVDNGPEGLRARLTLRRESDDRFVEVFELAPKDRPFAVCITGLWTRSQP